MNTKTLLKTLKYIALTVAGLAVAVLLLLAVAPRIPLVQRELSSFATHELSKKLNTEVQIGNVDISGFNHLILKDVTINDQQHKPMAQIAKLDGKIQVRPLLHGKVRVEDILLSGFDIRLEKADKNAAPNYQFIVDALKSDDKDDDSTTDIRIKNLSLRRGRVSYHILSEPQTPETFNAAHLDVTDIRGDLALDLRPGHPFEIKARKLTGRETCSGLSLQNLTTTIGGDSKEIVVKPFVLQLPDTKVETDKLTLRAPDFGKLKNPADEVEIDLVLKDNHVALKDLAPFVPGFKDSPLQYNVSTHLNGTLNNLRYEGLQVQGGQLSLQSKGQVANLTKPKDLSLDVQFQPLSASKEEVATLVRALTQKPVPDILNKLGNLQYNGTVRGKASDLHIDGTLATSIGTLTADNATLGLGDKLTYAGNVAATGVNLGTLLDNKDLGMADLHVQIDGAGKPQPYTQVSGTVDHIVFKDYPYHNIAVDGIYRNHNFEGNIGLNDANMDLTLSGKIDTEGRMPSYDFTADVKHFNPKDLRLTEGLGDSQINGKIDANFKGKQIDDIIGNLRLTDVQITQGDQTYSLHNLEVQVDKAENGKKDFHIDSDFLRGDVHGNFSYEALPASIVSVLRRYIPAFIPPVNKPAKTHNDFDFNFEVAPTNFFTALLQKPVVIYSKSDLKGTFDDRNGQLTLTGNFPRMQYEDHFLESVNIACENKNDKLHLTGRGINQGGTDATTFFGEFYALNDTLQGTLKWGNNGAVTNSGNLSADAYFTRVFKEGKSKPLLHTLVHLNQSDMIIQDSLWHIHPSTVAIEDGRIKVNNFHFSSLNRDLKVDGTLSKSPADTVWVDFDKMDLNYILTLADLGLDFGGDITGPAYASQVLDGPHLNADVLIKAFTINKGLLGDLDFKGEWRNDVRGIALSGFINEGDSAHAHVTGFVYPLKPESSLDLQVKADRTNLKFLQYYLENITSDFNGRATGDVRVSGKFDALELQGNVLADASMRIGFLNTFFSVKDSVRIAPEGITFPGNRLYDARGHEGRLDGTLRWNHFDNIRYHFNADVHDMLMMDTQASPDNSFYGTVYASGQVVIAGNPQEGLAIDATVTTEKNSTFNYIKDYVSTATNSGFITYVDKTPRPKGQNDTITLSPADLNYELALRQSKGTQEAESTEVTAEEESDMRVNLLIDVTPDLTMKMIMDPVTGDYVSCNGTGNIRAEYYNKADLQMFGNYNIQKGLYKLSIQELIRKDFVLQDGSSLVFNGNPMDALLDIKGVYQVASASLNDLIPNASTYVDQTNVRVNCLLLLSGHLTNPIFKMDLELPLERDEVQALVRNYIPTEEQMNTQILYLLGIGKFYTPEYVTVNTNSDVMSSMAASTISGQLNNVLSDIIDSNNWNFGTNFSTGQSGWDTMGFEGVLSGTLLNNRLLINGNFGYRENTLSNTNFVGDFDAQWLITPSGSIRLKAYNETNDKYYARANLTTQGIGIIFKKDFVKWGDLFSFLRSNRKVAGDKKEEPAAADSPASNP